MILQKSFVCCRKKVAIEAVLKKFEELDISEVFLDLHNTKTTTANIVEQCKKFYDKHPNYAIKNNHKVLTQLDIAKNEIWNFYDTIYNNKLPCNKSAKQVMEQLFHFEGLLIPSVAIVQCSSFSEEKINSISYILQELERYKNIDSIWLDVQFTTQKEVGYEHKENLDSLIEKYTNIKQEIEALTTQNTQLANMVKQSESILQSIVLEKGSIQQTKVAVQKGGSFYQLTTNTPQQLAQLIALTNNASCFFW